MKFKYLAIAAVVFSPILVNAQVPAEQVAPESITRPRTVKVPPAKAVDDDGTPTALPQSPAAATNSATVLSNPKSATVPSASEDEVAANASESKISAHHLSPQGIRARIGEAERLFKSRPMPTAMTPSIEFVILAALEQSTARIHKITIPKETFLTKGSELSLSSSLGTPVTVRILRANGVNTAVTVFDGAGRSFAPLLVEFPIEKRGVFKELAYYTSAHPALLSPDLSRAGQAYVRNMLDLAVKRLRDRGVFISPQIVDVAERLCLVEHVDHDRFRNENREALYHEIYSLFALNELDTYRYSVSSAGAGGMVQMIPWAYNLMRQRHPGVGLIPDFVTGMRNHANALQAMLLYMQDTWNDLVANDEVQYALSAKLATQTELLAAGYNSNAAKLPGYLKRGGSGWRTLIPRETQMYLQIYKNFESLVPIKPRTS